MSERIVAVTMNNFVGSADDRDRSAAVPAYELLVDGCGDLVGAVLAAEEVACREAAVNALAAFLLGRAGITPVRIRVLDALPADTTVYVCAPWEATVEEPTIHNRIIPLFDEVRPEGQVIAPHGLLSATLHVVAHRLDRLVLGLRGTHDAGLRARQHDLYRKLCDETGVTALPRMLTFPSS